MTKLLLALTLAGAVLAQTTTTYDITSGKHNGPAYQYQSQAIAYNSLNGITVYDAAGDRAGLGQPVPQFVPAMGPASYCIDVVNWTVADYPNAGSNGQVWTFSCPGTNGATLITATLYTTWQLFSFVEGGKGGSRLYWEKVYTVQAQAGVDANGNPVLSNVQITQ